MPQAREAARELDYRLRRGFAKHVTRSNPTLSELVDQYIARPTLRSEKWKTFVRHAIEQDLSMGQAARCRHHPCPNAATRISACSKRGPTAANQIMQALNTVWSYAKRQDPSLPDAPTTGLEWYPEEQEH